MPDSCPPTWSRAGGAASSMRRPRLYTRLAAAAMFFFFFKNTFKDYPTSKEDVNRRYGKLKNQNRMR
ncbi:uncharacterized protein Dvir_GJ16788 [Drosophila virilis]|uniref:Uncharacterized protein n=1 Tax=Drosophila virilis TaxID=7244 RepID=B4M8D0_DROVI|nr:uncharacterized protein Dvir_GJ16788 [Drosophila virilis]